MNFTFEVFGFCVDKEYLISTFWMFSYSYSPDDSGLNDKDGSLFLFGKVEGKWVLELFFINIFGPKEISGV